MESGERLAHFIDNKWMCNWRVEVVSTLFIFLIFYDIFMYLTKAKGKIKMKILLVEDEIDLNNIVTKYLKKNGYSVDSVFDGEEALDYLEYGEYDLVILDVMMPKLNGFEVIKELRNKGNHTSVLMLTARDSADDKVKGLDLGADDS